MYTPLDETMLQLGLYDYVWGDNTMLQNYLNRAEAEKNREAQREYNQYLKEYDRAKLAQEKELADRVEVAKLRKEYAETDSAAQRTVLRKELERYGATPEDEEMLTAIDKDKLAKEYAAEDENWRKKQALKETSKLQRLADAATKKVTKDQVAQSVYDKELYPNLSDDERNKLYADIMGVKTIGEQVKTAQQSAIASKAGEKTGKAIDDATLTVDTEKKIKAGKGPSAMTAEERTKARELGYNWTGTKWEK